MPPCTELRQLVGVALPIMLSSMLGCLMQVVDILFVGHLGTRELAAAAMGNALWATVALPLQGCASALDTFLSQSYGAKQYAVYGHWVQVATVCMVALSLPVAGFLALAEPLLLGIGQEPSVAAEAGRFCVRLIPGVPPFIAFLCLSKCLQAQNILAPAVYIALLANVINAVFNWLLIHAMGLGIVGAPLATSFSRWAQLVLLLIYLYLARARLGDTLPGLHVDWQQLSARSGSFLRLGAPGAVQLALEAWSFDFSTLMAGRLGELALDAHSRRAQRPKSTRRPPVSATAAPSTSLPAVVHAVLLLTRPRPRARSRRADDSRLHVYGLPARPRHRRLHPRGPPPRRGQHCRGAPRGEAQRLARAPHHELARARQVWLPELARAALHARRRRRRQGGVAHLHRGALPGRRTAGSTGRSLAVPAAAPTRAPQTPFRSLSHARLSPLVPSAQISDGLQAAIAGVMRGMGRQKLVAGLNLVGFWLIGLPVGAGLTFGARIGVEGLWWGLFAGLTSVATIGLVALLRTDWEAEARRALVRIDAADKSQQATIKSPKAAERDGAVQPSTDAASDDRVRMPHTVL